MSSGEVAAELGVTDRTVRRFADHGFLPAVRLTPRSPRRFRREDVDRLLSAALAGGSAAASNGAARRDEEIAA
jgi:excisionase family DNA binding protein